MHSSITASLHIKGICMEIKEIFLKFGDLVKRQELEKAELYLYHCLEEAREKELYAIYITICNEMIEFYRSTEEYEKALQVSEDVLLLMEELQMEETEYFADTLVKAAMVYRAAGKGEEAYYNYVRALKIYESTLEPMDQRFPPIYQNMSLIKREEGDFEMTVALLEKALESMEEDAAEEEERAAALTNLALVYLQMDQTETAGKNLEKALRILEKRESGSGVYYSAALAGMGEVYFRMGAYEDSLKSYEKALEETKKRVGFNQGCRILCRNCAAAVQLLGDEEKAAYYLAESSQE